MGGLFMSKKLSLKLLSVLLTLSLLVAIAEQGMLAAGDNTVSVKASGNTIDGLLDDYIVYNGTVDLSTATDDQKNDSQKEPDTGEPTPETEPAAANHPERLWKDGMIHVYNFRQLQLIGTNAPLTDGDENENTVGTGRAITDDNGDTVIYANDAHYFLEGDIVLPEGEAWNLSESFKGDFTTKEKANASEPDSDGDDEASQETETDQRLYDAESDTIYIQNVFQLKTIADDNRSRIPVMTGDPDMKTFGTGQLIYPESESGGYLTYRSGHNYVISAAFTASFPGETSPALRSMPLTPKANAIIPGKQGRDVEGQPAVKIGGTDYILIGDIQQLKTLNGEGDKVEVFGPVYKVPQKQDPITLKWSRDEEAEVEMVYPGDADLLDEEKVIFGGNNGILSSDTYHSLGHKSTGLYKRDVYCTIDPDTGAYDVSLTSNPYSDLKYKRDGNYIVFRDIPMGGIDWTPLMFNGNMYGVKSDNNGSLWEADHSALIINPTSKPIISDFNVEPEKKGNKLNVSVNMGVGFFGTLSAKLDSSTLLAHPSTVQNIGLSNVTVTNELQDSDTDTTIVSGLLSELGLVLGTGLDWITSLLLGGKQLKLGNTLENMLDDHRRDPSSLATGVFAGRIVGDVTVKDCTVTQGTIITQKTAFENNNKIVGVGGFVGYVQGNFQYDDLSNGLGAASSTLAAALNLIPGVGLGDLVTILLDNALPLDVIVPTGYTNPSIEGCSVSQIAFSLQGGGGKIGYGGFVGSQCGTSIKNCHVTDSTLAIAAERFGGGFAGVERDDIIRALLSSLKIEVGSWFPQSEIVGCSITKTNLSISGGHDLGGFIGVQANSCAVEDTIANDCTLNITASGDGIGGFTGQAELGSSFELIDYVEDDGALLEVVSNLLTDALGSGGSQRLLALGGVSQSGILGCQVKCPVTLSTDGGEIGGFVGSGEGVYIAKSSGYNIAKLNKYTGNNAVIPPYANCPNTVESLNSVHAGTDYAGGAAGRLISSNASSLLGDTLGLSSFLGFHLSDLTVTGGTQGLKVEAGGNYAGGTIGFAMGGDIGFIDNSETEDLSDDVPEPVTVNNLASVTAFNHAGGFVGTTGPDRVFGGKGLNLNLLGIDILNVNNLLSVNKGIHTDYLKCTVNGIGSGFTVQTAEPHSANTDKTVFTAGGFAGDATSITMTDCKVYNLLSVTSHEHYGKAGGFVGYSAAGSFEGMAETLSQAPSAININQLLQLESDVIPNYNNCEVTFVKNGYVEADAAGGFTGDFCSGKVNTDIAAPLPDDRYVVHNIDHVSGSTYAGGFGGRVYSGALLRDGGSGLDLLGGNVKVDITGIANINQINREYVPLIKYAGVDSKDGFSVKAAYVETKGAPSTEGYAGGYIGYGSGMDVSYSNVKYLKHRNVDVPAQLETKDGGAYMHFDPDASSIPYAVAGSHCAGGYIGYMNVGSATALGNGLQLLGDSIVIDDVLQGLQVVTSTVEHSDVYGSGGGYSVLASSHVNLGNSKYDDYGVGYAGGFAGKMLGAHIQDSNAENFAYIIGEVAAGGYAGEMQPGNVADLLDYTEKENKLRDLLNTILDTDPQGLLHLGEVFVPTIYNSRTTCIPCGGAVRTQSSSNNYIENGNVMAAQRGFAGGYVGHAVGSQIWGSSKALWKNENNENNEYSGTRRDCDAIRIRSVYGAEYAGGYVGLLEPASTAKTGNLSLLGGLVESTNLLGALNVVYPTIEHGNVFGPLEKIDVDTWNTWIDRVGQYRGFASEITSEIAKNGRVSDQNQLDNILKQYIYGYHVVAGRDQYEPGPETVLSGCAGGYAGAMHSGVIRYGTANNVKLVKAMRAAGGFAGEMQTKGLAQFGDVQLLDLNLNLGGLLKATSVLVPVIFESGVTGYQNGLIVRAEGKPTAEITTNEDGSQSIKSTGMAGGYVGACYGGQIGNRSDGRINFSVQDPDKGAWVKNLKTVTGTNNIGGFAGKTSSASVANVDSSQGSDGFVQGLLDSVISNPSDLVDVLDATITVIGKAEVTAAKPDWGIVIDGEYTDGDETKYAYCAGGFVGSAEATVFGNREIAERTLKVTNLRGVSGGYYAGGFFGLAQVGSVAQVGSKQSDTNVLSLIKAGNVSLLDIFRTYIYHASVTGVGDGIIIFANDKSFTGKMSTYQESGAAGGFGGGLMNGTVEHSSVTDVNFAQSPNYSGGFIGMCGTSSGISVDEIDVGGNQTQTDQLSALGLSVSANAELLNIVGSTVTDCSVAGFKKGFIVRTTNIQVPNTNVNQADLKGSCAAGFIGFADMTHIENSQVTNFKYAQSPQTAGGFVGRTGMNYLVDTDVDSPVLTGVIVRVINALVKALYLKELENADVVNLEGEFSGLKLMSDGDLLYVNLLGLKIGASLSKDDPDYGQDAVIVTIGSSTVKLPCDDENGVGPTPDISVTLVEGNRTDIKNSFVKGIDDGYDVFAGGADDEKDGTDALGYAGGFIGYNDAGMVSNSYTELCDVIRGTDDLVGPFIGFMKPGSRGEDYLTGKVENNNSVVIDNNNKYSIYRSKNDSYTETHISGGDKFGTFKEQVELNGENFNRYEAVHLNIVKKHSDLKNAVESNSASTDTRLLKAYVSPGMEVLMTNAYLDSNGVGDTPITSDLKDPCDKVFDLTVNKVWKDFVFLHSRPDSINVTITTVEVGNNPPEELVTYSSTPPTGGKTRTLTLYSSDDSTFSSSWQVILEDLPVASNDNPRVYYQYVISEVKTENYAASYKIDPNSASVDITNRYTGPLLPQTGGSGALLIYAVAIFLIVSGGILLIIRLTPDKNKGKKQLKAAADVQLDLSDFSDFFKYLKK